jgi:peptide/nickel transport system substrate-binding protein
MNKLNRLVLLLALCTVLLVVGVTAVVAQEASTDVACEAYNEAPELAERVAAGELPPVAERLPVNPRVVEPAEEIGQYGGQMFDRYDGGRLAEFRQFGYEGLVRWSVDGSEVIPNIAEGWEISADGTTYTFFLREGMKWSDGEPFTADDIVFWWEQVETNANINPGGPYWYYVVDGEPMTVTKIDDYTVQFQFAQPYGLFLQNLSASYGVRVTQFPEHYVSQFSMELNPEGVAEMMAEAGAEEYGPWWISRVGSYGQDSEYNDPNRPSLQPWVPTEPIRGRERFSFVRNPYYFKIDPACNQLPYIDERVFSLITDPEVALLATIEGRDSLSNREVSQPPNRAVYFDNMESGNYRFVDVINSDFNAMLLHLKLTHPDEAIASVLQDINFRIGLSQAMDRQTVIDTVYIGQGIPHQQAPRPESPFYDERLATQYTEYDVDAANAALDQVLPEKDAEGFRLLPNGERFTFNVVVNQGFRPDWVDVMQLVERDWEAVGIDTNPVVVSDDIWRVRARDNDIHAYVWAGENGTGLLPLVAAGGYIPEAASGWSAWNTMRNNPDAETSDEPVEPPAGIQRQYEIVEELRQATSLEAQTELMNEMLELAADQFFTIGLSLPMGDYRVAANYLRNVPEPLIAGWLYPGPAPANFETFYVDPSLQQ